MQERYRLRAWIKTFTDDESAEVFLNEAAKKGYFLTHLFTSFGPDGTRYTTLVTQNEMVK